MQQEVITSVQNPRIKQLLALQQKSSERRKSGLFVVEGQRELQHCIDAGLKVETVFCCEEMAPNSSLSTLHSSHLSPWGASPNGAMLATTGGLSPQRRHEVLSEGAFQLTIVTPYVYEKIAYRGSTEGIIAIVHTPHTSLSNIQWSTVNGQWSMVNGHSPLFVVLESVEKPGNLGAILRSADAAGVDAVIVCDPLTDLYNPNLIRSSIGAIFTVPTVACTSEECITWLKQHSVQILTAQLQDSNVYYDTDMTRPTAIVMGTESTGLTAIWREAADAHIRIPMLGQLDSLNVSVSAAILMFEAVRQRCRR